jgi:phage tail sheath gpL-like
VIRRITILLATTAALFTLTSGVAHAGSPHFVDGTVTASQTDATLTVTFKEAGLGDEAQVHVVLTADAACINPGSNHPKAANKESVNAAGDFPVQNGKTEGSLSVTATFQPACSPPMSVVYSNVTLTDVTSGITTTP